MADGDIKLIDTRLSNIAEILEAAVAEHGPDILSVTTNVDIESSTGIQ